MTYSTLKLGLQIVHFVAEYQPKNSQRQVFEWKSRSLNSPENWRSIFFQAMWRLDTSKFWENREKYFEAFARKGLRRYHGQRRPKSPKASFIVWSLHTARPFDSHRNNFGSAHCTTPKYVLKSMVSWKNISINFLIDRCFWLN